MKIKYLKYIKYTLALTLITSVYSCQKLVEGINDNPNQLTVNAFDAGLFLKGAQLSNMLIQLGELQRAAGFFSSTFIAFEQLEGDRYNYSISERDFDLAGYQSVLTPLRHIRDEKPDNKLYQGIAKVVEAHLMGTYASLFGDLPYSEALNPEFKNPVFDQQADIFAALQVLLDGAIADLENVTPADAVMGDYIFGGNALKWKESAYTLKARYYMHTKEYALAYSAAGNGISSAANSMMFVPYNDAANNPDSKNVINSRIAMGSDPVGTVADATHPCYILDLISLRQNAKTNEEARLAYLTIDSYEADLNHGVAARLEPQSLITYEENQLILAEAGGRTAGLTAGLSHLNALRNVLSTGATLNASVVGLGMQYDAYDAADFNPGGIENQDNIDALRAFLREVVEERYICGFYTFMPFDDNRRLQKNDADLMVPFPFNTPTQSQHVQRLVYPDDEMNANENAPADPGAYQPTDVNF